MPPRLAAFYGLCIGHTHTWGVSTKRLTSRGFRGVRTSTWIMTSTTRHRHVCLHHFKPPSNFEEFIWITMLELGHHLRKHFLGRCAYFIKRVGQATRPATFYSCVNTLGKRRQPEKEPLGGQCTAHCQTCVSAREHVNVHL